MREFSYAHYNLIAICVTEADFWSTRNTFCGTWYLPHSHVHSERTVLL